MNGIYYIENTIDEWHSAIKGYFATEEEARLALEKCYDWYRPDGTGKIYFQPCGLNSRRQLIYENR